MSWLATAATPRPPFVPSAVKLAHACAATLVLGGAEMPLMIGHVIARKVLPTERRVVNRPACTHASAQAAVQTTPGLAKTSSDPIAPAASCSACAPGVIVVPHPIARRLLRLAAHVKAAWSRELLRIYSVRLSFRDLNAGTPDAIDLRPGSPRGPYLFVQLNQNCLLESAAFPSVSPFPQHFLMNREFTWLPYLGWHLRLAGVTINRSDATDAKAGADEVVRRMREEGQSFYMSIEGHRSETGALHPYKNGAALIAIRAGATIIPLYARGMRDVLPYGDWRVRPGDVELVYERAIHTTGLTVADRHALTRRLWDLAVEKLTPPDVRIPPEAYAAERPRLPQETKRVDGPGRAHTLPLRSAL